MHDRPSVTPPAPHAFTIPTEITTHNSNEFPIIPTTNNMANNHISNTRQPLAHHHYIKDGKVVYCSFDVETDGEYASITCDLRWIWHCTQAPLTQLTMPCQMQFFLDPLEIIREYQGCMLYHQSKSNTLESLELGCVSGTGSTWHMTGNNLNGAHGSLVVDVKDQTNIVILKHCVNCLDKS